MTPAEGEIYNKLTVFELVGLNTEDSWNHFFIFQKFALFFLEMSHFILHGYNAKMEMYERTIQKLIQKIHTIESLKLNSDLIEYKWKRHISITVNSSWLTETTNCLQVGSENYINFHFLLKLVMLFQHTT